MPSTFFCTDFTIKIRCITSKIKLFITHACICHQQHFLYGFYHQNICPSHSKNNDFEGTTGLKRKSTFEGIDNEEGNPGGKLSKISTTVVNKGCSKVDSTITVEASIDEYESDDFSIDDTGNQHQQANVFVKSLFLVFLY